MESRNFYNEILTDHNLHPVHKEDIPEWHFRRSY